ncbi:MAG TPA: carbohydrate ABC transporter permease [Mycobacteriales bacterium]|nr:carbohydrate ABC transporter permease [Mycobacteriales bacterium]
MATLTAPTRARAVPGHRRRAAVSRGRLPGRVLAYAFALVTFGLSVFPVYWMVRTALEPTADINHGTPTLLPTNVTGRNFVNAVHQRNFPTDLRNSLLVSLSTVVLTLLLGFLAAAALARFRFRGRSLYLVGLLVVQMIPLEALIVPVYLSLRDINGLDQFPSLIVVYLFFSLPFSIWMLRSFIVSIPDELEEQAMVDGCSRMGAFLRVLLPLISPGLVAVAVYAFIQAWSEFVFVLVIMQHSDHYTLPRWVAGFQTSKGIDWGAQMAGSALFTLPVIVFFLFVQRRITTGLAAGAVKG